MSSVEHSFHVPPFPPFPSAERYVPVGSQDEALQRIQRAIEAWEAISLVIGPPGVGKSLLCQMLLKQFAGRREVVMFGDAMLDNPVLFQKHLLTRLNRVQGIHSTPLEPGEDPQFALVERLARSTAEFPGLLLLVDEAQALTPEVLETIRIITNTMSEGQPRVSAVLLGGPKLDETLALPSLEALVQRVATRCYLHPLNGDEAIKYVQRVIEKCGSKPSEAITDEAIIAIHKACSGTPRLINQMMTAAIDCAASLNQSIIDTKIVDRAWAMLQQLPSPVMDEPTLADTGSNPTSNVEFGSLDDSGWNDEPVAVEAPAKDEEFGRRWDDDMKVSDESSLGFAADENLIEDNNELHASSCDQLACGESACEETGRCQANARAEEEACSGMEFGSLSIDCQTFEGDYEVVSDVVGSALASDLPEGDLASTEVTGLENESVAFESDVEEEQPVAATPSAEQLFGEFDDEEEVGRVADALTAGEPADGLNESMSDLETSLHEEILSLRGAANSPLALVDDNDMIVDDETSAEACDNDVCDQEELGKMQEQSAQAAAAPVLWMDEDSDDMTISNDDRDMLIIEDDVQVETAALHHEAADLSSGRPVAVDFQAMLAKMRSPQS
ncbi:ExeA family protein [Rhodopirellula halodulae]|uniref:ExeA family protein n=1 Tax=Rhodopirellula halodulae TaxID=2894198 RepID=UPI001E452EA0|nr:AAA family ATPase [Rhodopirellula sp. JC737]MCC9655514.1 AAA family ATPase [Rhodopirellula sp. JC737]